MLRGRGERDRLAADEHQEDEEGEAQQADAPVHTAAAGDSATAAGGPGERTQSAAAPAGRATPSWLGRGHQGLVATLPSGLDPEVLDVVGVHQAELLLGDLTDADGGAELGEVLRKLGVLRRHGALLARDGVGLDGLLYDGEAQRHAAHSQQREAADEQDEGAREAGALHGAAPRLRRPARGRPPEALVSSSRRGAAAPRRACAVAAIRPPTA